MKLIKKVDPACPCLIKIYDFIQDQFDEHGNSLLGVGSVVECDCGQQWQLQDFRTQGRQWVRVGKQKLADKVDVVTVLA